MRSVISPPNDAGHRRSPTSSSRSAGRSLAAGLVPIIEPEVDIKQPDKAEAEELLHAAMLERLDALPDDSTVMFKLTHPDRADDLYADLVAHPAVLRVRRPVRRLLAATRPRPAGPEPAPIASFSRALTEDLRAQQTDAEFDRGPGAGNRGASTRRPQHTTA